MRCYEAQNLMIYMTTWLDELWHMTMCVQHHDIDCVVMVALEVVRQ